MKKLVLVTLFIMAFFCSSVYANQLEFEPIGGGKFIYCNNPEGIGDDTLINGDAPRWLMNNKDLTEDLYYIYLSHFNYTGNGKMGYDIELDMAITAKEDSKIVIHKAFFDTPQNYAYYENWTRTVAETDWGQLQVCADMSEIPLCEIRGNDFYYPRDFEPVELEIKAGETVWLSQFLSNYQPIAFVKAVHIQGLIEIQKGVLDFNVGALKSGQICGDRENIPDDIAFGEYRWDYTLKGIADTLPEVTTDIEYTITEETQDGEKIPVFLKNQYIPDGHTVTEWYTQLNPQNDIWSKTTAAETDILPLFYEDDTKLNFYGSNVAEKDNIWVFDTLHSGVRKYESRFNTGKPEDFVPNFLLSTDTDNHTYACNIGNYGVSTTYKMKITNETDIPKYCSLVLTAASEVIAYETDINGNKGYGYIKDLTGEKVADNMLSHQIPPNSTEEFSFSIILPVNYNGGIKNELVITDGNIQAVDFEEKKFICEIKKQDNGFQYTDIIYGEPLNEVIGLMNDVPQQLLQNAHNYEYIKGRKLSLARWCVWDGAPDWYYNLWSYIGGVYILDENNNIINIYDFPSHPCGASYADDYLYIKTARDGVYKSKDGKNWEKTYEPLPEYVPYYDLEWASDWAVYELEDGWDLGIRLKKHTKNGYNFTSSITREEFCELLLTIPETKVSIDEIPEIEQFNDTENHNIGKLAALGIIKGFGDGTFRPKDMLTREQAAVILARYAELFSEVESSSQHIYADSQNISDWATEGVNIVYSLNIMHGIGDNLFDPQGNYSREQSAATVLRLYNYIK